MSLNVQAVDFQQGLNVAPVQSSVFGKRAKRAFDLVAVSIVLLALLPLLGLITVLIRRDGGPSLFRHQRIGAGGRPFMCLKFRSMCPDSDAALAAHLAANQDAAAEWRRTQKLLRDPRVTAVGRILRKTSLDELPQLFNVLLGDMSLVGPRPITSNEAPRYGGMIRYYYAATPGITGLWQVSGRNTTSYARRVELDVEYVQTWTFRKDIVILARTVPAVVFGHGAC